jgi:nucleoside 2-deoxyribosyltransferase
VRAYVSGALNNVADLAAARTLYETLGDACDAAGCPAYVPHQHADPERDPQMSNREVAERDLAAIAAADVVVAHLGEPSLGVGAELALALHTGKRILALARDDQRVSRFALGLLELHPGQAEILRYRTIDEACAWIGAKLGAARETR